MKTNICSKTFTSDAHAHTLVVVFNFPGYQVLTNLPAQICKLNSSSQLPPEFGFTKGLEQVSSSIRNTFIPTCIRIFYRDLLIVCLTILFEKSNSYGTLVRSGKNVFFVNVLDTSIVCQ